MKGIASVMKNGIKVSVLGGGASHMSSASFTGSQLELSKLDGLCAGSGANSTKVKAFVN